MDGTGAMAGQDGKALGHPLGHLHDGGERSAAGRTGFGPCAMPGRPADRRMAQGISRPTAERPDR
ncbi:hypothetical protein ACWD4P_31575 [Kitasatospora sp. NPDC002543]